MLELQHHSLENKEAFILFLCRLNTLAVFLSILHHLHYYRKISNPGCCSSSVFVSLISLHTKQNSWVSISSWSPKPEGKATKPLNSFISSNLTCSDASLLFLHLCISLCPPSDWFCSCLQSWVKHHSYCSRAFKLAVWICGYFSLDFSCPHSTLFYLS